MSKAFNKTVLFLVNTCRLSVEAVAKAAVARAQKTRQYRKAVFKQVKNINVEDLFIYFSFRNRPPSPSQVTGNIALSALETKVTWVPEEPFKIIRNVGVRATDLTGPEEAARPPAIPQSSPHPMKSPAADASRAGSLLHMSAPQQRPRPRRLHPASAAAVRLSSSQWPWPLGLEG